MRLLPLKTCLPAKAAFRMTSVTSPHLQAAAAAQLALCLQPPAKAAADQKFSTNSRCSRSTSALHDLKEGNLLNFSLSAHT